MGAMRCCVCETEVKGDKWNTIRAHAAGWFQAKDGHDYCPEHVPAWVADWRKKRDEQSG